MESSRFHSTVASSATPSLTQPSPAPRSGAARPAARLRGGRAGVSVAVAHSNLTPAGVCEQLSVVASFFMFLLFGMELRSYLSVSASTHIVIDSSEVGLQRSLWALPRARARTPTPTPPPLQPAARIIRSIRHRLPLCSRTRRAECACAL
jgi:hypothetical protein